MPHQNWKQSPPKNAPARARYTMSFVISKFVWCYIFVIAIQFSVSHSTGLCYIWSRLYCLAYCMSQCHDDVIKWKHFPRHWPFVRGIHKGQWRGALMFSLICAWINDWVNKREAGDLRRHRVHHDVTVMYWESPRKQSLYSVLCPRRLQRYLYHIVFLQSSEVQVTEAETKWQHFAEGTLYMNIAVFEFKFHWNLFEKVHLIMPVLVSSVNSLVPNKRQAISWTNNGLVYRRIYSMI